MPLFHVFDLVDNRRTGVPMAGVQVRAKFDDTDTIAPIYADQSGTAFDPANYCVTDADGMFSFYIDSGEYTLEFLVGDVVLKTIPDFRPAEIGPSGPANSTFNATAEIENADVSNVSAILAEVGKAGTFTTRDYVDFTAQVAADPGKINYIRSVSDPTKVWVRTSILSDAASQTGASSGLTVDAELAAKATLTGVARTATNLGTFTGSTIPDNQAIKGAIQALETAVENTSGNAATKVNATAVGVAATDANMGTTTGSILSDNATAKDWFGELETATEARPTSTALAASDGSALGFLQAGTGAVARTARDKHRERVSVKDFGAVGDGATNDTAAIQAAITYIQTQGGGVVFFPCTSASYRVTGTLNIIGHGVTLELESAFTKLVFANGSSDCIVLDGTTVGGAGIYNLTIRNGLIDHSGKTGGTTIKLFKANNVKLERVQINNAYQPLDFNVINSVEVNACTISDWNTTQYFARFRAPGDGSARSDALTFSNCSINGAGDGLEWDGLAHTLRLYGGNCINVKNALVVKNTAASTQYFPQFLEALGWEVDGATVRALDIQAGRDFDLTGCVIVCASSAAGPVINVAPDTSGSITSNLKIKGGKYKGGQGKILSFGGRDLTVVGGTLADGSGAGSGSAQVIELTATANNCLIVGNRLGGYWGSLVNHSYAITVASGAVRVIADNNDCYGCVTGEVLDNSGSNSVMLGGGVNRTGTATRAFLGNIVTRVNIPAAVENRITNSATGAACQVRWVLETGTANSYRAGSLIDNSGSPYYIVNGGSGVTISYDDIDTHHWRTLAGSPKASLTTARFTMNLPVQLKAYTVATLPASPSQGDLAIVTDSNTAVYNATVAGGGANVVKVCYLGGTWKVG